MTPRLAALLSAAVLAAGTPLRSGEPDGLERGWANPPPGARVRAYWWWLNGNVTKEAVTRDLEEMKAKGFGGALICDAGGASQDGNDPVPHGPTFLSDGWRVLYRHALREADRLGLEMSLNIQSGWNLGGPTVGAVDAAKALTWSAVRADGPGPFARPLPEPEHADSYYQDLFVIAYRLDPSGGPEGAFSGLAASSELSSGPAHQAGDGDPATFWVSGSVSPGAVPTEARPEWLEFRSMAPVAVDHLTIRPRDGCGPRGCALRVSDDGKTFRPVSAFDAAERGLTTVAFPPTTARAFRLVMTGTYDRRSPQQPISVQIAELALSGPGGSWPAAAARRPIRNWAEKVFSKALASSAPDTRVLLSDVAGRPGEEDARRPGVVDLTAKLGDGGALRWEVPEGAWQVFRFGCTVAQHAKVSTSSHGWGGYALDVLDAGAFNRYWDAVVEPLVADAGPLAGRALKYLHTDSWEVEAVNWTPTLRDEFRRRRGYELLPFLPVMAGRIVDSRAETNRFLHDYRKTLGDLAVDHHFAPFRERAHRHGLEIHPESGGPHAVPIDAQRCLGQNDMPMSEFWAESWRHRVGDTNRFFLKQPASAAHTYGKRLVAAEGFTTIGPHWQERLWSNLKPSFDFACCEGMNRLFWHAFVCSPADAGVPGQQYFAGTHLNPNTTWWAKSAPFFAYLNRCQFLLQQGRFVADACVYYGDHVPNFARLRASDPARLGAGYDYDVVTEEVVVSRLDVKDGRLTLPDGMSYGVLVLPERAAVSLPVLRRVKELVNAGATVIGPKPDEATGLAGFPESDAEVRRIAGELWGGHAKPGRVVSGRTARDVLQADGVGPDFEVVAGQDGAAIEFIHRRDAGNDIYFVASRAARPMSVGCAFRVAGKAAELWDAVTGDRRGAAATQLDGGRMAVALDFAPFSSVFVVFREPTTDRVPARSGIGAPSFVPEFELGGPWEVAFDPKWGGPASAKFDRLVSWTTRPEPGIRFYSGTATYRQTFDLPDSRTIGPRALDLGDVRELAEVRLNGQSLGIVWAPPFRVELTAALKPRGNVVEVEVVNFWPNRIIGDASLAPEHRLTRTNIRAFTAESPLMESGLLGPVRVLQRH
jgi:alpha-L-rhamnosidase/F5/8 type C domain